MSGGYLASFLKKLSLNTLKLSMLYSGSRLSIHSKRSDTLEILGEEMQRAIDDARIYEKGWSEIMSGWNNYHKMKPTNKSIPTCESDLYKFLKFAINGDGLASRNEIQDYYDITDSMGVLNVFGIACSKELFEMIAPTVDDKGNVVSRQGTLTDEEFSRHKPKRGPCGQIYRVTQKGRDEYARQNHKP